MTNLTLSVDSFNPFKIVVPNFGEKKLGFKFLWVNLLASQKYLYQTSVKKHLIYQRSFSEKQLKFSFMILKKLRGL